MKYTLILFSFLYALQVQAQSKWTWGLQTQIGISGQNIEETTNIEVINSSSGQSRRYASPKAAIGLGLYLNRTLNKHLSFHTGIQYLYTSDKEGNDINLRDLSTDTPLVALNSQTGFDVHRMQISSGFDFAIGQANIRPIIGLALIWNEDFIRNLRLSTYNALTDVSTHMLPLDFQSSFHKRNAQWQFKLGLQLTPYIKVYLLHHQNINFKNIKWTKESYVPGFPSIPITNTITTYYNQMSSVMVQYRL